MPKMSVGGHRNDHDQTGRLCQNRRCSGVFDGSMFCPSRPSARSRYPATLMKTSGGNSHQPPLSAPRRINGKTTSGR